MKKTLMGNKYSGTLRVTEELYKGCYSSPYITYFLTTRPTRGVAERITPKFTCREEYISDFRIKLLKQHKYKIKDTEFSTNYDNYNHPKMSLKKTYIGVEYGTVGVRVDFSKSMIYALDFINVLEEKHGWPLTTMYKVLGKRMVVFCGTNKWMKSPFALSIYTLLMRVGQTEQINALSLRTHDKYKRYNEVVKYIKTMDRDFFVHKSRSMSNNRTLRRLAECIDVLDLFMENYNSLFKGRSFLSNYGYRSVIEFCGTDKYYVSPSLFASDANGIKDLIDGRAADLEIVRRFRKIKTQKINGDK